VTECAELNEDGLPAVVTGPKKEITTLRAALNKKTYELHKLKKDLCHESTLIAKMADFEKEIYSLKQEKLKLSENLSEKIVELKATHATVSLLGEKIQLMENESVKHSKMLETSSKEVQSLKSRILNQDQETDRLCRENVTLSRSLEKKCEEIRNLTSENSELKKENSEMNN
jgi:chromosome segregation ATPase